MPDVFDIVAKYLEDNGYDGLYSADGDCACEIAELAPCSELGSDCRAGYRVEGCNCGEGHRFHIQEKKPDAEGSPMTRPAPDDKRKLWVVEIREGEEWFPTPIVSATDEGLCLEAQRCFPRLKIENTRPRLYRPAEEN